MDTMSPREFDEVLGLLHLSRRAAAIALGVSERQVFYYLAGEPIPAIVAILLRTKMALVQALRALQELDPEWYQRAGCSLLDRPHTQLSFDAR